MPDPCSLSSFKYSYSINASSFIRNSTNSMLLFWNGSFLSQNIHLRWKGKWYIYISQAVFPTVSLYNYIVTPLEFLFRNAFKLRSQGIWQKKKIWSSDLEHIYEIMTLYTHMPMPIYIYRRRERKRKTIQKKSMYCMCVCLLYVETEKWDSND